VQLFEQIREMLRKLLREVGFIDCPQRLAQTVADLAMASKALPRR